MQAILYELVQAIVPVGVGVVLPIMVVWRVMRNKEYEAQKRTEIILAVLEKNPDVDVEEYLKKLNPPTKTIKERLMTKLLWACVLMGLGLVSAGFTALLGYIGEFGKEPIIIFGLPGGALFALGVAFLIVYLVSKKTLAMEIELESKKNQQ